MPNDPKNPGGATPPGTEQPVNEQPKVEPKNNEAVTVESLQARISELNEENKKHRLRAKEAEATSERVKTIEEGLKKVLGLGPKDPLEEKLQDASAKSDARVKRTLLKAAVVEEVAKDAHSAEAVWKLLESDLKDVSVDLDAETVDRKALREKLEPFKKSNAYLFQQPGGTQPPAPKQPGSMPNGGGIPGGGDSPLKTWKQLKETGNLVAAQQFYLKNREAIIREQFPTK